jgi:hypothetical protein
MRSLRWSAVTGLLAALLVMSWPAAVPAADQAPSCQTAGVEVDLAGSGDLGIVSGRATAACRPSPSPLALGAPYSSDEILCAPEQARAAAGRCSAVPCHGGGQFFAMRTLHEPGGGEQVAGFACVELGRARVGPGIAAARVFEAVRAVKLPGGTIRVTPSGRGLANLAVYFQLAEVAPRTVELALGGSRIHAEFEVVEYRWDFGDGSTRTSMASGLPDAPRQAHAYPHRGTFRIRVEVGWSAEAFLDGRRVGRVDGLVSHSLIRYPVAEIRGILSG